MFEGRAKQGTDIVSGRTVKVGEDLTLAPFETLVLHITE